MNEMKIIETSCRSKTFIYLNYMTLEKHWSEIGVSKSSFK